MDKPHLPTLGTRGNSLAKSGQPIRTSRSFGFSKRAASGTQGIICRENLFQDGYSAKKYEEHYKAERDNVGSCWHLLRPFAWAFKPGFHIIVRVVLVFSNDVQATGTIIWKHYRYDRGRSKKTEKTGTTAIAWIEKFLSGRPKRSRETVNILMETTFG